MNFSKSLLKKASPNYVNDTETYFYPKVFSKIKNWYMEESNKLENEVSNKKMDIFFKDLFLELKLDNGGALPFSTKSLQFSHDFL